MTINSSSSLGPTAAVKIENISSWDKEIKNDPVAGLAATVVRNVDANIALINRDQYISGSVNVFSDVIDKEGSPITNQKSSGRCWLFAATNCLRIGVMKKFNLEEFQLSPSYLFFYDKLEKSNYFLDQIIQTASESVESRLVQHLLTDPICDGGQFDMFANIVSKYGLVPNSVFPDTFNTTASSRMNFMVTTLLRQFAQELRDAITVYKLPIDEVRLRQESQMKQIHKLLTLFLGSPPGPNDNFRWEFKDKDKKFQAIESTPLKYYEEIIDYDARQAVSLLNDPRNPYNRVIIVERLGNVVGDPDVSYLNLDIDQLADAAVSKIKNNEGVFFGSHTPIYMDKKSGIMDVDLWDYKLISYEPTQAKADRLRYHQSLLTHAMVLTGVHLDDNHRPVRWRVENSWGEDVGQKGYFSMTHDYFKEYVYQVVVERQYIPELLYDLDDKEPIILPPWDPCGALAK